MGYFHELFKNNFKQFLRINFKRILKNDKIILLSQSITTTGYDLF